MSDIAAQSDQADLPEGEPVGEGDEQTAETIESPEPEIQVWDEFDNHADQYVQIVVDGEPQTVRLAELRDGYQRQADYTRKTQALAEERQQLERARNLYDALDRDPATTLRALQAALLGDQPDETPDPEDEFLSDEEKAIRDLRSQVEKLVEQQQYAQISAQFDAELDHLKTQHGLDDEATQELIDFAVKRNYSNFTDAYARLRYERASAEDAVRAAEEARRAAARQQAQVVSGGSNRNSAAQPSITPRVGQSMRESFEQAKAMLAQR